MGEWIMDLYSVSGDSTDHECWPLLQWDHEPRQDPRRLPWTTDIHMASAGSAGRPHQYGPLWYLRRENYRGERCFHKNWPVDSLWDIFIISGYYRQAQPTASGVYPGQVVLGFIYKRAGWAREEEQAVILHDLCFRSCLQIPELTSLHGESDLSAVR